MKKIAFLATAAAFALGACAKQPAAQVQTQTPNAPIAAPTAASTLPDQVFTCKNGMTATVKHNAGEDKIRLFVNTVESSAILTIAPSASGERYTNANGFYNKPTEFHFKGKEGHLSLQDPYGNKVNTTCRSK